MIDFGMSSFGMLIGGLGMLLLIILAVLLIAALLKYLRR
jgi:hypothetical protein|tara:strand:- start:867 stop:983 length:117 start_codon:yes stop_codon:yes gene_type:complete